MQVLDEIVLLLQAYLQKHYGEVLEEFSFKTRSGRKVKTSAFIPMTAVVPMGPEPTAKPLARHSDDFRSVNWFGQVYSFTLKQALVVQKLWEAWEDELPEVSGAVLLEAAESEGDRLRGLFIFSGDKHPAWGTMIVPGVRRGTYRLSPL